MSAEKHCITFEYSVAQADCPECGLELEAAMHKREDWEDSEDMRLLWTCECSHSFLTGPQSLGRPVKDQTRKWYEDRIRQSINRMQEKFTENIARQEKIYWNPAALEKGKLFVRRPVQQGEEEA